MQARSLAVGILLGVIIGSLAAIVTVQLGFAPSTTNCVTVTSFSVQTQYVTSAVHVTVISTVTLPTSSNVTTGPPKWLNPDEEIVSDLDAKEYVGQTKTVEGTIVGTYRSGSNTVFLNFHDPYKGYFTVVIFSSDLSKFTFDPEKFYLHKEVRVKGQIQLYQGAPEIIVRGPSQIEVAYMGFNYP